MVRNGPRTRSDGDGAALAVGTAFVVACLVFGVVFGITGLSLLAAGFGVVVALGGAFAGVLAEYRGESGTSRSGGADAGSVRGPSSTVDGGEPNDVTDALETLRRRYARGELSDDVFERKLEALLETEVPEDARRRARRTGRGDEASTADRELESTRS